MIPALLDASLRACGIALAVGMALAAWRVRSAAIRHAAWTSVLIVMLALPVLPYWMPHITLPLPGPRFAPAPGSARLIDFDPAASAPTTTSKTTGRSAAGARTVLTAAAPGPTASSWPWSRIVLALWSSITMVLVVRLASAWRRAGRLGRDARLVESPHADRTGPEVFESWRVATPVTVGVWRPHILLPLDWTGWRPATLRAALAHERAHISRRDPLVAALAELNTCIFWFHPLAWWLRRQISRTAEHACDDRTLRSASEPAEYAQVLIEMAAAVQRRGGRVSWASLGIGDRTGLERRLDRVLRGDGLRETSALSRLGILATCLAALVVGIACRQGPVPLKEDPVIADRLKQRAEGARERQAIQALTRDDVTAMEAVVAANPDDLATTGKLLAFYRDRGQALLGWDGYLAARRRHVLRIIERHPEDDLATYLVLRKWDPAGYAQARALWMAHVDAPDVTSKVLGHAATFFAVSEKPVAEALLLRARAMDPDGPQPRVAGNIYYPAWAAQLGRLYAQAIVGSDDDTVFDVVKSTSRKEAHGPFAAAVRANLEATTDAAVLAAAGQYLLVNVRGARGSIDFDTRALGLAYLERAASIDPGNQTAKVVLAREQASDRHDRVFKAVPAFASKVSDADLTDLSERERFEHLANLAESSYSYAEMVEAKDPAEFKASLERADHFAEEALALSARFTHDPLYGAIVFRAHITLGTVALRRGDRATAVREMRLAAGAPSSPEFVYYQVPMHTRLTNYLLKAGERASVVEFFEKAAALLPAQRDQLLKDADAVRNGMMPMSYQYAFARP